MPTAKRLKVRVFLEGVEVPAIAAQVEGVPNSPMVATIQMPPLAEGLALYPRTLVHIFFRDHAEEDLHIYERGSPSPGVKSTGRATQPLNLQDTEDLSENAEVEELSSYKLMFVGELSGYQWSKRPISRSLVLQCVDLSNYWDYAYQWKNTDLFGPGFKAMFSGGGTSLFTDFLFSTTEIVTSQLRYGMTNGSIQYPAMRGLMGGLLRILEQIGGSYYSDARKDFKGANPFFALAEMRLHITQMITAYDKDQTASRLLGGGFFGMFGRTLGNLGDRVSVRSVINALTPVIFHSTCPQPCPMYVPGSGGNISGHTRVGIDTLPEYRTITNNADGVIATIDELVRTLPLPKATVADNGLDDLSQFAMPKSMVTSAMQNAIRICQLQANRLHGAEDEALRGHFKAAAGELRSALQLVSKWDPGNTAQASKVTRKLSAARERLSVAKRTQKTISGKDVTPARLQQQIFRPDVWFSAPPRCNVIFPDQIVQFNYARSFFQEPTRLLLKTNNEFFGEDMLFDKMYFAPRADLIKEGGRAKNVWAMMRNDLMEHELFTGILPVFEKMGEFSIFAAQAGKVNGRNAGVDMAQRSTNFLFFVKRFGARQAQLVSAFDPYLALGFPALIIDKYLDPLALERYESIQQKYGRVPAGGLPKFGANVLGQIERIQHSLDNDSAYTTCDIGYARLPDESVEFLGIDRDQKVAKRYADDAVRVTDVAAFSPPAVGALGPAFGEIVSSRDVTGEYTVSLLNADENPKSLPLYTSRRSGKARMPPVVVGVNKSVESYGSEVAAQFSNPAQKIRFRAFRVEERIPRYRQEIVDLPAEEYIRPGWYGDCWHPGLIGRVYQEFFGTGSITDPQQVGDPGGESLGDMNRAAEDPMDYYATVAAADPSSGQPGVSAIFYLPRKHTSQLGGQDVNYVSVQDAVEFIVKVYSYIRTNELSASDFARSYKWRPIATMLDMFGTADLEFDPETGEKIAGTSEGFHSRAFGDFENIFTLLPPDVQSAIGIGRWGKDSPMITKGDTRRKKRDAVIAFVTALVHSPGVIG